MIKITKIAVSVACAAVLICALSVSATAKDAIATAVRITGNEHQTQFQVDLTKALGFTVDVLPNPYRVIINAPLGAKCR